MGKIIFYEDPNFQGRCYECNSDCSDLHSYFTRCHSIRVESGCWILYEHPDCTGYQYVLMRGEYPEPQKWMSFSDSIKSCRMIRNVYGNSYKIRVYERTEFRGQMKEYDNDCDSIFNSLQFHQINSCIVLDGIWVFYDQPSYMGHQYFLDRGEYRCYTDWGSTSAKVGSFRRITEC
ncbi:gamma-crystallin M2-like [Polypterus senegalus]|uniref:gamma-crystallin M2-like n=1 Tax=Polypterus senegalus TaxID=55291 RepID=UPI001966BB8B|nr:gamma-crystallin M2-like [Polypterus senegalus]